MARPRYQDGSLFIRDKNARQSMGGSFGRGRDPGLLKNVIRTQPTVVLGAVSELSRREARLQASV